MKTLILEYITGGGMVDQELPASLVQEGGLMLSSAVNDFKDLASVQVITLRDYRLSPRNITDHDIVVDPHQSCVEVIHGLLDSLDAVLIIAPETDNVLTKLCTTFINCELQLLNSTIQSIKLASNKLATYKYLQRFNFPQIPTYLPTEIESFSADKYVLKPEDGVGCENLYLFNEQNKIIEIAREHVNKNFIVQPFIEGNHASLSLMCWEGDCILLSCNEQDIVVQDNKIKLIGCDVNAFSDIKFVEFSKSLVRQFPGLRGYIGVDVLITDDEILLVEINPRLTTSYVGLKQALGINPAELTLQCFIHKKLPEFNASSDYTVTVNLEANRAA